MGFNLFYKDEDSQKPLICTLIVVTCSDYAKITRYRRYSNKNEVQWRSCQCGETLMGAWILLFERFGCVTEGSIWEIQFTNIPEMHNRFVRVQVIKILFRMMDQYYDGKQ
jgi:hypothetical protein